MNKPIGLGFTPDFRWPEQRLVIEADSREWHDDPIAQQDDATRQAILEAAGERVLRVTWRQAIARPTETLGAHRGRRCAALRLPKVGESTTQ